MSSASDDSSDEEYKPQGEESDCPSDAETDYDSDGNKLDKTAHTENKSKKRRKAQKSGVEKRMTLNKSDANSEKDELEEDDEEEKRKNDALWASFLSDTNQSSSRQIEKENKKQDSSDDKSITKPSLAPIEKKSPEKYVTKIFDFAGEEVKITEKVKESNEAQISASSKEKPKVKSKFELGPQRSSGSGLAGALSQLGKRGKISTLEKTKLDWMNYKKNEGIEEELQTHNKGKDGYLERQDFLERTDLRQFERERDLRQTKRSNR